MFFNNKISVWIGYWFELVEMLVGSVNYWFGSVKYW